MFGVVEGVDEEFEGSIDEMIIFVFGGILMGVVEDVHDKVLNDIQKILIFYLFEL